MIHSKMGNGWYLKGSRTAGKVKLGYENFYIYGAANSWTGAHFNHLLPKTNVDLLNIFIQEFLKNKKIILVVDRAGWHKSINLVIPENITRVFLPPYSPELNPIERVMVTHQALYYQQQDL